jgi:2-dehydropantoate 2-reductase
MPAFAGMTPSCAEQPLHKAGMTMQKKCATSLPRPGERNENRSDGGRRGRLLFRRTARVVLFAVKLWDTETAANLAKPLVGPSTRIITLQNGVDSYERVSAILGKEHTVCGTAYIAAVLGGPGVMKHTSKFATMRVGRMDGKADPMLDQFVAAAKAANIDIQPQDDMNRERWQKFIFLSSMAGANCMTREPIGKVLADPDTRAFYRKLMEECLAVGQKSGAKVPNSWVDDRMTFSDNAPPGMKASMFHDLEAGNRLELDWLTGKVVSLGHELGVPVPASEAVYAAVKLHRMGGG